MWTLQYLQTANHKVEMKEGEKRERLYQDLATELQILWNEEVTVFPIVIGALGTVSKSLKKIRPN